MIPRIGCVSYLNSRPLVWGLDDNPAVRITYDVPANLLDMLTAGHCDLALLPIIDYQRADDLVMVPASCIGADGAVYTVRLYSQVPAGSIRRLYLDTESHTSVALCRILLHHVYHCEPVIVATRADAEAVLLIGDKVVSEAPDDAPFQLDLAQEWKNWLGLPFVFATWMCRQGTDVALAYNLLKTARAEGIQHIDEIVAADAGRKHWPADLARRYLSTMLKFDLDLAPNSPQRLAIEAFHRMAFELGFVPRCRPIHTDPPIATHPH